MATLLNISIWTLFFNPSFISFSLIFPVNSPLVLLLHHLANHFHSLLSAGCHSGLIKLSKNLDCASNVFFFTFKTNLFQDDPFLHELHSTYLRFKAHQVSSRSLVILVSVLVDPAKLGQHAPVTCLDISRWYKDKDNDKHKHKDQYNYNDNDNDRDKDTI